MKAEMKNKNKRKKRRQKRRIFSISDLIAGLFEFIIEALFELL